MFSRLARFSLVILVVVVVGSCNSEDSTGPAGTQGTPGAGSGDFVTLERDGGPGQTYTEATGVPVIDCDPRVDWAAKQVVLWHTFTTGLGPNGYDHFFEIMFPNVDTVGTYTVQGDNLQALFYDGTYYSASPIFPGTSGTVQVTRSDTRIEGVFDITVVDTTQASLRLSGSFGVDSGFSLVCP